jgi:hypothetical protein
MKSELILTEESDYSLADDNGWVSIDGREFLSRMEPSPKTVKMLPLE